MKHLFKLLFLLTVPVVAVGQDIRLADPPYGMTQNDTLMLGVKYNNDYAACKAKFPKFMGELESKGASFTWNKYTQLYAFVREAQWANDDYIGSTYYPNGLGSKAHIHVPHGVFKVNKKITAHQGGIFGGGTQGFMNDPLDKSSGRAGGTTLVMDVENWIGNPSDTACFFEDLMWGDRSLSRYMEGVMIGGFKLEGRKGGLYEPSKRFVIGIRAWTRGENSMNHDIFIYNCDVGVWLGGQYHATYTDRDMSIFGCTMDGYRIVGGAHMRTYNLSTDNNPTLFHVVADGSYGFGNGFILDKFGGKNEDGKAAGQARQYSKGGCFADVDGGISQINVFGGMWSHNEKEIPENLFRLKGQWTLNVFGMSYFTGPVINTLIHDRNTKTKRHFTALDGSRPQQLSFCADWTGYWFGFGKADPPVTTNVADNRLAPLQRSSMGQPVGVWDQVNGLPAYSITAPMIPAEGGTTPPPTGTPCTGWIAPDWPNIPCINGTKTGTAQKSPVGCTGTPPGTKPAESQTCTVTPPPSGTVKWTSSWPTPHKITSTYCVPVNVPGVTVVEIKQLKPSALTWGRILGEGGTTGGLQISPAGEWYWRGVKIQGAPKVTVNVAADYTITLPSAGTITAIFQTSCNQGGAQQGTIGTLTLK